MNVSKCLSHDQTVTADAHLQGLASQLTLHTLLPAQEQVLRPSQDGSEGTQNSPPQPGRDAGGRVPPSASAFVQVADLPKAERPRSFAWFPERCSPHTPSPALLNGTLPPAQVAMTKQGGLQSWWRHLTGRVLTLPVRPSLIPAEGGDEVL